MSRAPYPLLHLALNALEAQEASSTPARIVIDAYAA